MASTTHVPPTRPTARARILETADRLFYNEGIHAVGINRIVAEAGVTRVTLYRHFPSKDDLIGAYLEARAQYDRDQVDGLITAYVDDPRGALAALATVLTDDDFAAIQRGCPFINSSAEYTDAHITRIHSRAHRAWVTGRIEDLLTAMGHSAPASTAQQLMMLRTGAVVSRALDDNADRNTDFLTGWGTLIGA